MTNFEKVRLFMTTFGQEVKNKASLSSENINNLRINLIEEELNEFKEAVKKKDLKEAAKNLYKVLRNIKNKDYKSIAVEKIPNYGFGEAINERLKRASAK